jgi:hypothetical protein
MIRVMAQLTRIGPRPLPYKLKAASSEQEFVASLALT